MVFGGDAVTQVKKEKKIPRKKEKGDSDKITSWPYSSFIKQPQKKSAIINMQIKK